MERAEAAWEAAGTDVARHNLAVLNHLLALADDHEKRTSIPRWRRAHGHWLAVWRSESFWQLLNERVRRLNDVRLGPYTAPKFRAELPRILAQVSAAVAVRWTERGASDDVVLGHWQLGELSGFPADERADARQAATESVVARIRSHIEESPPPAPPRNLYTAAIDSARTLHAATAAPLRTLVLVGAPGLDAAADAVAERLLEYAAGFEHDRPGRRDEGLAILQLAAQTARGDDVSRRITAMTDTLTARKNGFGPFTFTRRRQGS